MLKCASFRAAAWSLVCPSFAIIGLEGAKSERFFSVLLSFCYQTGGKGRSGNRLNWLVERLGGIWRRRWDSNPRRLCTLHDFQSCSLDHYETPPQAERVGFEPTRTCALPLFESGTFDHSDISPCRSITYPIFLGKRFRPFFQGCLRDLFWGLRPHPACGGVRA